jgi:hypothetical protein
MHADLALGFAATLLAAAVAVAPYCARAAAPMSDNDSECELYRTLGGVDDATCEPPPEIMLDGETQGLALANPSFQQGGHAQDRETGTASEGNTAIANPQLQSRTVRPRAAAFNSLSTRPS